MAKPANSSRRGKSRGRSGGASQLYAALDLGTNNCRLLIAEPTRAGGLRVVDSFSQIVTLGEGLATSGELSEKAMGRAIEALRKCSDKVKKHRPMRTRYIATQACRQAANGKAFLTDVQKQIGLRMETITPKEEAKYALLGSLDLVDPTHDFALVIDIGGGSTELSWIDAKSAVARGVKGCAVRPPILGWASFPVGVVTLNEAFTDREPGWYLRMVEHVETLLRANDAATRFGPLFRAGRGQLIGNSGTVTSLVGVHLKLDRYVRSIVDGQWLAREDAIATRQRLHDLSPEDRAKEGCLTGGRSDLMLPGLAILDAVWQTWPADRLRVGDRGLREGILLSMMHGGKGNGPAPKQKHGRGQGSKGRGPGKPPSGEGAAA
ncbi:MAG: Ppx/GppA family phosphatase [Alphaproteobacteria bacterium]|jgi:exopolyphosphatase / guanosine-5'-triphosphate,3'-diphosphate pyrophosphatase|nr:MAG: Ppx/GppA family phosphatase [Alphaproteobacteria bacterium]